MQSTPLAAPVRRDYMREVAAATPLPADIAGLRGAETTSQWYVEHHLPTDLLTGGQIHGRPSCDRNESNANDFCSCAEPTDSDRTGLGYLRKVLQRTWSAERAAAAIAATLRSPGVTWKELGEDLDSLHFALYWIRRYETESPAHRAAMLASDRLRPVYEKIAPILDAAATWYDHLAATRIPETWTGADRTPYLAVVWSFDNEQTFGPGRGFFVATSQVVATAPEATVRLVEGRNTARVLRGTYGTHTPGAMDPGEDDWLMHPLPASWTGPDAEARYSALAATLTSPRDVRSLAELVSLVDAAFL